jgi:hypothetical protein
MTKRDLSIIGLTVACISLCLLVCLMGDAQAQLITPKSRGGTIAINSADLSIEFTGVKSNGDLGSAGTNKSIISNLDLKEGDNNWQELWVEFTPVQSGKLLVEFRTPPYFDNKVNRHEVWLDDVSISGGDAQIQNGSFEALDQKDTAVGWAQAPSKDKLSTDGSQARTGKNCALIWISQPLTQGITVKAGEKYKVSAWFKPYYK